MPHGPSAPQVLQHEVVGADGGGGVEEAEGGDQLEHRGELLLQDDLVEGVVQDEGLERGVCA